MVGLRNIAQVLLLLSPLTLCGQNYSVDDTVTEYPNKGTYYHNKFEGRKTANGEIFDQNLFTAAHWKIPLGTYVMVTNQNTGLQVIVRVNDRCPKHGVFDMSHRAANSIGIKGCQPVTVRILPPNEEYIARWKAQDSMFDSVYSKFGGPKAEPKPKKERKKAKTAKAKPDTQGEPAPLNLPIHKNEASTSHAVQRYNLSLCTVESHSEAFASIQKLPRYYQDKIIVDSSDHAHIRIILDVRLPQKSADELSRALRPTFPQCKTVPSE